MFGVKLTEYENDPKSNELSPVWCGTLVHRLIFDRLCCASNLGFTSSMTN